LRGVAANNGRYAEIDTERKKYEEI
jgi:hypothetical protein